MRGRPSPAAAVTAAMVAQEEGGPAHQPLPAGVATAALQVAVEVVVAAVAAAGGALP